jgi:hypothetical protein
MVLRWRDDGDQRARRFATKAEARAFDEGVSGGRKADSSTPSVYPYEMSDGTCWRYSYRASRGRLSTKRGPLTRQAFAGGRDLSDVDNVLIAAAACELHPTQS